MINRESQFEDLKNLVIGKLLGFGVDRHTYDYLPDKNLVIKLALENPKHNIIEDEIWQTIYYKKELSKWFAPCYRISQCGMFLLQEKIETKPAKYYPKEIPQFFTDTKYSNYGWFKDKFVCCDYSRFGQILLYGKPNMKMKKANWND